MIEEDAWNYQLRERGFVPLLDDHQSNYVAVIVLPPLAFRVAHLPHDDGSRLLYRDVDTWLSGLLEAMDASDTTADLYFHGALGDYRPDAPRPIEDQEAARTLLSTKGEREEWNYAAQLLDSANLDEWARLLETDHFVRRDVRARMQKMSSPAIRELLRRDQETFEAFATMAADAAQKAGLTVGRPDGDSLRVGGKWMNLDAFFHRRNIPNATSRMVAWFEDVIAGRDPRQGAGHYMSDSF